VTLADLIAPEAPATLTVEETAELLHVSRGSAYESARRGELPTLRLGRRVLVPVPALLKMLEGDG
jgi:excisionase family DNA binding protein